MAERQSLWSEDRFERYAELATEVAAITRGETSMTARYSTTVSLLVSAFGERFFWCGFYEVDPLKERELVVGPYQGTLGCLRIPFDKGVCGACASRRETIIVPDVHEFPGHIACDSRSRSEIVVPVFGAAERLIAVLDVDSTQPNAFDLIDAEGLRRICDAMTAGI